MVVDEIEAYLRKGLREKTLIPGDKLPSYAELEEMFHTSYMTIQRCLKKLEQKGLVKIVHGVGSFLNGGDSLDVDLYLTATTFDFEAMQKILDRISRENNLFLNIHLKPRTNNTGHLCVTEHKVVITEADPWLKSSGFLLDYSMFPDYADVMASVHTYSMEFNNLQLPFYFTTSQGMVNLDILRKLGFRKEIREFSDLAWWEELDRKCRACGEFPAVANFSQTDLWHFPAFVPAVLLMMQERRDIKTIFRKPVFSGETGKRIFRILDTYGDRVDAPEFPLAGAVNLDIGSWFPLQAGPKFHISGDSYRIVPLRCGGHKILKYTAIALQTFINASISDNEKKRVWELLKHLLSRKVQKEITAMSGAISFCSEMTPEDHSWVDREDFFHFFPQKGDYLVSSFLLPLERVAVLSALYEQYRHFGADAGMIRQIMDAKLLNFQIMDNRSSGDDASSGILKKNKES